MRALHSTELKSSDIRRLSPEARLERRLQAVRLRAAGYTYDKIAAQTSLSRTGVFIACRRYAKDGESALHDAVGGRRFGEGRLLTAEQEHEVRKLICDRTPDQLTITYALWTSRAVADAIERRFGVRPPVRTMGLYLSRWGFSSHKPIRRSHEQPSTLLWKWLEVEYPAIIQRARAEGAEIHWADATKLRSNDLHTRSFITANQAPAANIDCHREGMSIISAIANHHNKMRWKIFKGALDAEILINFFGCLIRDVGRKVFLILDGSTEHLGEVVKVWLAQNTRQIEVFYLPSCRSECYPGTSPVLGVVPESKVESLRASLRDE